MDQGLILIHVSGAVRREGVYRLKVGDRKIEAIQLAGGALITADLANLNLAEPIKDGERVVVPTKRVEGEKGSGYQNISLSGTAAGLVNINTAKAEELDKLQGIGLSTAKSIIEYRKKIGFFNRIEQLMELPRFGKAKFERIKNQITI
jgi:competence protein ComEA